MSPPLSTADVESLRSSSFPIQQSPLNRNQLPLGWINGRRTPRTDRFNKVLVGFLRFSERRCHVERVSQCH